MQKIDLLKSVSILVSKQTPSIVTDPSITNAFGLFLFQEWAKLSKKVLSNANSIKATTSSVDKFLKKTDKIMGKFPKIVDDEMSQYIEFVYKFSKNKFIKLKGIEFVKKIEIPEPPTIPFGWVDKDSEAIEQLDRMISGSTATYYNTSIQKTIHESVRKNIFESQLSTAEAAKRMKRDLSKSLGLKSGKLESKVIPQGYHGTADAYFKGLVEHSATMARTSSSIITMDTIDAKWVQIFSIRSSTTCIGCLAMDGKKFKTGAALDHVNKLLSAKNSQELKEIQPWFHLEHGDIAPLDIINGKNKPGFDWDKVGNNSPAKSARAKEIANSKNVDLPPFHFKCYCYTDMG